LQLQLIVFTIYQLEDTFKSHNLTQEDFNELHHQKSCNSNTSTVKAAFKVSQK